MVDRCQQGMKLVPAGSVTYTAYSYPRGTMNCKPFRCKPGRFKVPPYIKRITVPAPCPQKCTINKPVKRRVTTRVAKFCVSKPIGRNQFTRFAQKSPLIAWAKAGLMSRLVRNKSNTLPVEEQFFVSANHGVAASAPVRGISVKDARAYCRAVYGARAMLPSEAQWEYAYGNGKISSFLTYMEILSTRTRTPKGWMNLIIGTSSKPGFRWAMSAVVMSYTNTFRCVAPTK